MRAWMKNGFPILQSNGRAMLSDACCCGEVSFSCEYEKGVEMTNLVKKVLVTYHIQHSAERQENSGYSRSVDRRVCDAGGCWEPSGNYEDQTTERHNLEVTGSLTLSYDVQGGVITNNNPSIVDCDIQITRTKFFNYTRTGSDAQNKTTLALTATARLTSGTVHNQTTIYVPIADSDVSGSLREYVGTEYAGQEYCRPCNQYYTDGPCGYVDEEMCGGCCYYERVLNCSNTLVVGADGYIETNALCAADLLEPLPVLGDDSWDANFSACDCTFNMSIYSDMNQLRIDVPSPTGFVQDGYAIVPQDTSGIVQRKSWLDIQRHLNYGYNYVQVGSDPVSWISQYCYDHPEVSCSTPLEGGDSRSYTHNYSGVNVPCPPRFFDYAATARADYYPGISASDSSVLTGALSMANYNPYYTRAGRTKAYVGRREMYSVKCTAYNAETGVATLSLRAVGQGGITWPEYSASATVGGEPIEVCNTGIMLTLSAGLLTYLTTPMNTWRSFTCSIPYGLIVVPSGQHVKTHGTNNVQFKCVTGGYPALGERPTFKVTWSKSRTVSDPDGCDGAMEGEYTTGEVTVSPELGKLTVLDGLDVSITICATGYLPGDYGDNTSSKTCNGGFYDLASDSCAAKSSDALLGNGNVQLWCRVNPGDAMYNTWDALPAEHQDAPVKAELWLDRHMIETSTGQVSIGVSYD